MNKIEDILDDWFKKKFSDSDFRKKILDPNMELLKEAFVAGYEQSIIDRKKLSETMQKDAENIKKIFGENKNFGE
jgi:hypothetical protein